MRFLLYIAAFLLAPMSAAAQEDWEAGLTEARLVGDTDPVAPAVHRPQLKAPASKAPVVIGVSAAIGGGIGLVASWAMYIARQNYRQRTWLTVSDSTVSEWEGQGEASLWLGVGGSALLVTSEYLLLPESRDVPGFAWISGAVGLGVAAVGVGFAVGGSHCGPQALTPGALLHTACMSGTADALFGTLLMLTAAPFLNVPVTYLLRKAFAGAPESLSFGPGSVQLRGRF